MNLTYVPGSNVKLECEPISNLAQLHWYDGDKEMTPSEKYDFHEDSLLILDADASDARHYSCWSVEHKYRRQEAEYRLTMGTNGNGGWELPTSPQARSSHQKLVGLQVLVVLLSVMLALLLAWNVYKGHLSMPCNLGRGQGQGQTQAQGSQGDVQQPLQSPEDKSPTPTGNSNNNHANLENTTVSMDDHGDGESSI